MMLFTSKRLTFLVALSALVSCLGSLEAAPQPTSRNGSDTLSPIPVIVGQKAPALSFTDALGHPRRLAELGGKRHLLLTFFPRCFTGNCTSQLTSLRDSYSALQKAGVEVWAVSTDAAEGSRGQRAFAKHLKLPFPLLPDTNRKISLLFGAVQSKEQMAARMSVFIDKDGVVRWIDKQINPRTHGADVLARLQSEGAPPAKVPTPPATP